MQPNPIIGIVGSHGAYGLWLSRFFRERMGLVVLGSDPAAADSLSAGELLQQANVLVFSTPIRHTVDLISQYTAIANGAEKDQLWLDVTSIKSTPVAAMLASRADVVGLHPMTAPPKAPTLKGRVMVVCQARLQRWHPWVDSLLTALQAECVHSTPAHHDQVMALVQAMVHASHLAQASVLREYAAELGSLEALMPYRSASFELDTAIISRILSMNPAIYEDIQFGNPHVSPMLDRLVDQLSRLRDQVRQGGEAARADFRQDFLTDNLDGLGEQALQDGNYRFERLGYLLADLTEVRTVSVHLPVDQPGSLRQLLRVFEDLGISLSSLHSSRTPQGEVHFRIGFDSGCSPQALQEAAEAISRSGIGRIVAPG